MRLIADLHIHSHYSRATSKDLTFEHLARWAQLKGVQIVGTGDIAHPGWLQEMREKLIPAEAGLFRLKPELDAAVAANVPPSCRQPVRFLLAGEISNIYKRHGAVRKVHNVIFAPHLDAVERIQMALEKIGNIRADGRPILGLDSRDLLEILLTVDPRCHLIPAHIWTPWFSMLGSKSGFASVEECFGDLTPHIFALETGLSSDPPMNWRVSNLDRYTLVSNSDAHSPQKLAREATIFTVEPAYDAIFAALQSGDPTRFGGTVEFFPEEGKYHLDGHRACGVCWEPETTIAHQNRCPVCGKEVTVGVMHRVAALADRPQGERPARTFPFYNLIPLPEVLGEVHGTGSGSRRVEQEYMKLLKALGPELTLLLETPLAELAAVGGSHLAEGIRRMRQGEVTALGGYDGEYGVIHLFAGATAATGTPQIDLFASDQPPAQTQATRQQTPAMAPRHLHAATGPELVGLSKPSVGTAMHRVRTRGDGHDASLSLPLVHLGPRVLEAADPVQSVAVAAPAVMPPMSASQPAEHPGLLADPPAGARPWLERLNAEQRAAAECVERPLLIVAGPGTGKTRTLTVRIAHLIRAYGVPPAAILAITFTNKAAAEMAARLADLLDADQAQQITVATFHKLGAELLYTHAAGSSLPANFVIAGEEERREVLKLAMPELSAQEVDRRLEQIALAKNRLLGPEDPQLTLIVDGAAEVDALRAVYRGYEAALAAAQSVDFDDLLLKSVQLLEHDPAVRAAVQARCRWISVDEYQDMNLAQVRLLHLLAGGGANVCVIGDPDQAIYGFRGADPSYFAAFHAEHPGTHVLQLRTSYRAPQALIDAAAQVIARNPARQAQQLLATFAAAVKVAVYTAPTDKAEAEYVVHQIEQLVGGTSYFSLDSGRVTSSQQAQRDFGEIAVLYRLNTQARLLVEALERSGIPYQVGGQTLADQPPTREVVAGLWLLHNPTQPVHLRTLLGAHGVELAPAPFVALHAALTHGEPLHQSLATFVRSHPLQPRQAESLVRLATCWAGLVQRPAPGPVVELVDRLAAHLAGLRTAPLSPAHQERLARLRLRALSYGPRLAEFLAALALDREADALDPRASRVSLLTVHAAKGLEFPTVFMVGCEEGLLPYLPPARPADLEEERRLFYVGMTRAQQQLVLTHARRRTLFGAQTEPQLSRFVDDIETALKALEAAEVRAAQPAAEALQLSLF